MSDESRHDAHDNADTSPDVSKRANVIIWVNFILLTVLLFSVIGMLTVFFDESLSKERYAKVESLPSQELLKQRQTEDQILLGEIGVEGTQKHESIENAMDAYLVRLREGKRG